MAAKLALVRNPAVEPLNEDLVEVVEIECMRPFELSAIRIGCTAERAFALQPGSRFQARLRLRCSDDEISWDRFGFAREPFQLR